MDTELKPMTAADLTSKPASVPAAPPAKDAATEIEAVRAQLLRPLPSISLRGALIVIAIIAVLSWSLAGSGPSPTNRITSVFDPFIAMGNLLVRMLPPTFEIDRIRSVDIQLFGTSLGRFTIEASTINLFGTDIRIGWLPVISAIFETIQMAIIGTLGAVMMALPLSLLAARNTAPHPVIYQSVRLVLNLMRSVPELVWALLFVAAIGLGPFTGVLALAFGSVGSLTRVFSEAIEQIDPAQVAAVRATGAGSLQTFVYSVIPQAVPLFISYTIIYFESNVRHATILGYVGAGGVGFLLFKYTGTSAYDMLLGATLIMVVAVTIIDRFSSWLRARFI